MLTRAQEETLKQLPPEGWGVPLSTTHNGTLAALIKKGLVEWSERSGVPARVWTLSRGSFRLTNEGQAQRYGALEREHFGDPDKQTGIYADRSAGA